MPSEVSDEQLVVAAQNGDRDAFQTLYNRYLTKVHNRVKSRIPIQDVEDVTQEVFIAVVKSLDSFAERSRFSTWLYTIVNRQIADYYRRFYRRQENMKVGLEATNALDDGTDHDRVDTLVIVQQALHSLQASYQEIILMRFADGLPFADIAKRRGQTLEATKSLYRRAIQAISNQIDVE